MIDCPVDRKRIALRKSNPTPEQGRIEFSLVSMRGNTPIRISNGTFPLLALNGSKNISTTFFQWCTRGSMRNSSARALRPNNAMDGDTVRFALWAAHGVRHRER